jgi:hypothetical protein
MDELMLDWLYDELDPPRSARVAEHMGTCARCAAEIGALRRTREAFRDLTDVEPPASLSAILLHEAARRAPQTSSAPPVVAPARAGWWARLLERFRPVVLHPAAAAVAMLVLVAGVAGTLYVRHGDMAGPKHAAEQSPTASPAAPVPADSPAPPPPAPAGSATAAAGDTRFAQPPENEKALLADKTAADPAPRDTDGVGAGLLDGERQAELKQAQAGELDRFEKESKKIPARIRMEERPKAAKVDDGKRGDVQRRGVDPRLVEPGLAEPNTVSSAGPLAENREADDDATDALDRRAGAEAGAGGAAPPAQTTPPAEPSAGRFRPYRDPNLSRSEQGWLFTQEGKLDTAVRNRQCRQAAAIANDILDRNPEYYARRVKDSQAVQPCQWFVSDEQGRRTRLRAQKSTATKARRKGGSASQKVKAAPERDAADAAEKTSQ